MYHFNSAGMIVRESDGACIPPDPNNTDYANLMKSIAFGVEIKIAPYVAPPLEPKKQTTEERIKLLEDLLIEHKILTAEQVRGTR